MLVPFKDNFVKISRSAFTMLSAYDLSISAIVISAYFPRLSEGSDSDRVAALGSVQTMMNIVFGVFAGIFFALSGAGSETIGVLTKLQQEQKQNVAQISAVKQKIALINKAGLLIALCMVSPIGIALFYYSPKIYKALGQSEIVVENIAGFLKPYSIGVVGAFLRHAPEQIIYSFGFSADHKHLKMAMYSGLATILSGAGLSSLFVFVFQYGITGLAVGYSIANYLIFILNSLYIHFAADLKDYRFFDFRETVGLKKMVKESLLRGLPQALNMAAEMGMGFALNQAAAKKSVDAQASMGVCLQLLMLMILFTYPFGQSSKNAVSYNLGKGQFAEANQVARHALLTTLLWIIPICATAAFYPESLLAIVGATSSELANDVRGTIPVFAAGVALDAIRYCLLQELFETHEAQNSTIISTTGLVISGVFAWVLNGYGAFGIAAGYTAGMGATVIALGGLWRNKMTTENITKRHAAHLALEKQKQEASEMSTPLLNA